MTPFFCKKTIVLLLASMTLTPVWADTAAKRGPSNVNVPADRQPPELDLPEPANGEKALDHLRKSGKFKEFSEAYEMSPEAMESMFRKDKSAHVDRKGRLFHVENGLLPDGTSNASILTPTIPLVETFLLHSKPKASKTIYLDFKGRTVTGTGWNTNYALDPIVSSPFDIDGLPGSFNATELSTIQEVWKRVSDDFAAFDVDVTTQDPPSERLLRATLSDNEYGVRVLVTKNWTPPTSKGSCGCSGFAYVGVFPSTSEYYKLAFVFADVVWNTPKNIAEVVSHEAGHTLGLSHDGTSTSSYYRGHGTGETSWAPIMGAGFSKNLTQWSRGEYPDANNKQDDFLVMASKGLALDTDDFGDTTATAFALKPVIANGLNTVSLPGVIHGPADVDMFQLNAGLGPVNVSVRSFQNGPNVDTLLTLRDAAGNVLAQANEPLTLGTSLTYGSLSNSTLYLSVEGTGKPDPLVDGYTRYGNAGTYTLSASYPISANLPPQAQMVASTTSGVAPLSVNFSATGSVDPDGALVAYNWDFGDGTSASGASVSKTYGAVGEFTASLVVTDNGGLRSTPATALIKTTAPVVLNSMSVGGLSAVKISEKKNFSYALITVKVLDSKGAPVPGVTVSGSWGGITSGSPSVVTDSTGTAVFRSSSVRQSGTVTFTVKSLSGGGYTYDSGKNVMSSVSVTM